MSTQLTEPRVRRWKASEYRQARERGWFAGQRVQLVDGEVIELPPATSRHARAVEQLVERLRPAFEPRHALRTGLPLAAGEGSEVEPDVLVAEQSQTELDGAPETALLVAEVADNTLKLDRRKAAVYAASRVREYWLVNLSDRTVELHRHPSRDMTSPTGYRYTLVTTLGDRDTVACEASPAVRISVGEILK